MARTYASVNEAWRELRNARNRANQENYRTPQAHHGYDPNQPRVAKGRPDAGQWTDTGGGENTSEISSDATPDNEWRPGSQYAQTRGRGSVPIRIGSQWFEATPGQAAELAAVQARYDNVTARVRELDPSWKPTRSLHEQNVDGFIQARKGETGEAEARLAELTRAGIGPGPFAGESIPARGPGRDFTASERREINRILNQTGCHTCGTFNPGTRTGNAVPDHQVPTAWNPHNRPQRLYPQCLSCSGRQGNWIMRNDGTR
jgi:hypothetical protein